MPTTKSRTHLDQLVDGAIDGGEKLLEMALDVQDVLTRREMNEIQGALDALRRRDQPDALHDLLGCAFRVGIACGSERWRKRAAAAARANPLRAEIEKKLLAGAGVRAIVREYGSRAPFNTVRNWQRKLKKAGELPERRAQQGAQRRRGQLRLVPRST